MCIRDRVITVLICFGVCALGLQKGVERITKAMMLCLLCLMVVLAVHSVPVSYTHLAEVYVGFAICSPHTRQRAVQFF